MNYFVYIKEELKKRIDAGTKLFKEAHESSEDDDYDEFEAWAKLEEWEHELIEFVSKALHQAFTNGIDVGSRELRNTKTISEEVMPEQKAKRRT